MNVSLLEPAADGSLSPEPESINIIFIEQCDLIFVKNQISAVGLEQERYLKGILLYVFLCFFSLNEREESECQWKVTR